MTSKRDPYAAFRLPSYRHYVIGWLVALLGASIQTIAVGWEVYQRTGNALALGLVGLVQAVPTFILALPAGLLADRFERRRLLMISMGGMMITSLMLAVISYAHGPVILMYLALFLDATALALGRPARMSFLPLLVPRELFPNAVTWNTSISQISSVAGPAIGGIIVAFHVPAAYLASAAASLMFMILLSRIHFAPLASQPVEESGRDALLAGLRFIRSESIILIGITLDMLAVMLAGASYLMPIFARDILKVGAQGYGWLNAAPAAGALVMALLIAHLPPMRHAGRNILLAVAGFGAATIVFGLSRSFVLSLAMLFVAGAVDNVSVVIRHTLIQLLTPDRMRGRVSAVNTVFIVVSNELGGFESGLVARLFNPVVAVVSGGIGALLVVAATAIGSRRFRSVGALHEARPATE